MPKRLPVALPTPEDVTVATEVFGSEFKVHLIRYFKMHPGARQADVAHALGVDRSAVSWNVIGLTTKGILVVDGPGYRVDVARCRRLIGALETFLAAGA